RTGCGRPQFGSALLAPGAASGSALEGATAFLAEIAQSSLMVALVVDEAERLAESNFAVLSYLLHNAPPNLRLIVGARAGVAAAVQDLRAYGQSAALNAEALRFRLEETLTLVRGLLGARVDTDACAQLHELTEGWPLGLQLALSAIEKDASPTRAIATLDA